MKYKYFLILVLLNGFSFITLSSGNKETILKNLDCNKMCCKYSKKAKPENKDNSLIQFSPVHQFLIFM